MRWTTQTAATAAAVHPLSESTAELGHVVIMNASGANGRSSVARSSITASDLGAERPSFLGSVLARGAAVREATWRRLGEARAWFVEWAKGNGFWGGEDDAGRVVSHCELCADQCNAGVRADCSCHLFLDSAQSPNLEQVRINPIALSFRGGGGGLEADYSRFFDDRSSRQMRVLAVMLFVQFFAEGIYAWAKRDEERYFDSEAQAWLPNREYIPFLAVLCPIFLGGFLTTYFRTPIANHNAYAFFTMLIGLFIALGGYIVREANYWGTLYGATIRGLMQVVYYGYVARPLFRHYFLVVLLVEGVHLGRVMSGDWARFGPGAGGHALGDAFGFWLLANFFPWICVLITIYQQARLRPAPPRSARASSGPSPGI
eukprot:tig00021037_g17447.t1